jgi:structural maintenance of chromosome 4
MCTKSYYGRHTIGPFHGNFTSIVGPNGSGKSNVIDSLLFVLGFRSNRTRAKKIANMIHKSTKHTHCDYCSVTVNFVKVTNADGVG